MADIPKVVWEDDGGASGVAVVWSPLEPQTQGVLAVDTVWDGQLLGRGQFDDDYIWDVRDFKDERCCSLIPKEGAEPVFEGLIVVLAVVLDCVRGTQDHDPLGISRGFVRRAFFAHWSRS